MWEITIRQADTGMVMAQEVYDDPGEAGAARHRAMQAALSLAGDWDVEVATADRREVTVDRYRGGELVVA